MELGSGSVVLLTITKSTTSRFDRQYSVGFVTTPAQLCLDPVEELLKRRPHARGEVDSRSSSA
jgi:hypothetical protein